MLLQYDSIHWEKAKKGVCTKYLLYSLNTVAPYVISFDAHSVYLSKTNRFSQTTKLTFEIAIVPHLNVLVVIDTFLNNFGTTHIL